MQYWTSQLVYFLLHQTPFSTPLFSPVCLLYLWPSGSFSLPSAQSFLKSSPLPSTIPQVSLSSSTFTFCFNITKEEAEKGRVSVVGGDLLWTRSPPSCASYCSFLLLFPSDLSLFIPVWNHQFFFCCWAHCHLLATRYKCPFKVTTLSCCLTRFPMSLDLSLAVSCHI